MIFNSLLDLADKDLNGVYKFICRLFYECNVQLNDNDCDFIFTQLTVFKKLEFKDFNSFIKLFKDNAFVISIIKKLAPNDVYGCFTNKKRVFISTLDSTSLSLTIFYLNTFGYDNIRN